MSVSTQKVLIVSTGKPLEEGAVRIIGWVPVIGELLSIPPNAEVWLESPNDAATLYRGKTAKVIDIRRDLTDEDVYDVTVSFQTIEELNEIVENSARNDLSPRIRWLAKLGK